MATLACFRLSDLKGLDTGRMLLGSRGSRSILNRTKTTGPGKQVRETLISMPRRISLTGHDWLRCGFDLWESYGFKTRDYFVMTADANLNSTDSQVRPSAESRHVHLPGVPWAKASGEG